MSAEPVAPQNLDAEESVLGAIMVAGTFGAETSKATLAAVADTGLRGSDFYRESHRLIYDAALAVSERGPTDVLAVADELRRRRQLDRIEGAGRRLHELASIVPAISNAPHFARLVVEEAERREAFSAGHALQAAAQNGALLDDALREQVARVLEPGRSTRRAPAHSWRRLDLIDLGSEPPAPPDVGGLFYSGRRHVISGEDDSGKTMLLLGISADELRAGRGVVWIDTDEMGASTILERLHAFGVEDEAIRRLFAYLRPEEALTDAARDDVLALLRELDARLMVSDAFNAALTLHGYSPNQTEDVEAFWQRVVAPFCRAGAAVVLPDHVVKVKEARGRYAYGSERKATGCDLHLGLQVIEPFGRGRRGMAKITVHRDRIGFLERPGRSLFVLDSDLDTGRLAWTIESGPDSAEGRLKRPTRLMEKVSDYLARFGEPCSRKQIEHDVKGKTDFKRLAIDVLVREGYAVEIPGERGARLVKHVRPFREADEWAES